MTIDKTLLCLSLLMLCTFTHASPHTKNTPNYTNISTTQKTEIDQIFNRINNLAPGVALGVIQNGDMVYSKGFGLANLEHRVPITTQTAFNVASISKQFTAACILKLGADNKLQLDQTLDQYFPDFPAYAKNINISHLLHHTSGLRDFTQITYLTGLRPDDFYDEKDIMAWISQQQALNFEPGGQYMYSNSGYWLLGRIVEKTSGMSLRDYAKQNLFEPLGMQHTQFMDDNTQVIENRASGYSPIRSRDPNAPQAYRHIYSLLERTGESGIYTSVEDLKLWADEWINHQQFPAKFWQSMTTVGTLNNGEATTYAKGLDIDEHLGHKTIGHAGRAPGYQSQILQFPAQKTTLILLSNSAAINAPRLAKQVASVLLPDNQSNETVDKPKAATEIITLTEQQLQSFASRYWSTSHGFSRNVAVVDGQLTYQRGRGRGNALLPNPSKSSVNSFTMADTPPGMTVEVRFDADANHKVQHQMVFIENGTEVDWFKAVEAPVRNEAQLRALTGDYYAEEIKTQYTLKPLEEGQLELFINNRSTVRLQPEFGQVFSSPLGLFEFELNAKGAPKSFTVSTPRVKKLKFLKQ